MRYAERIVDSSKPGKYFLLLIFIFLLSAISAIGQTREEKKLRMDAVKALRSEKFGEAISIYTDLLKLDPNNPDYNYEMGLAIYEQGIHRGQAAQYLEKAIQNTKSDTLADMFLFAGKSEQYAGNFDIAIDYFEQYKIQLKKSGMDPNEVEEDVNRYIEMCENGMVQFENNLDYIRIENMGEAINSPYPDYSPVVTNDESIILFTSRRDNSTGGELDIDDKYFEDIYYSISVNGEYTPALNYDSTSRYINSAFNTEIHDATITYSNNETELFIYRDLDVWVSKLEDGFWTIPTKAGGRINSDKGFEPSVFITQDQKTMFVVSDIKSGLGGRDIYITTKDDFGQWKALENLGKNINTKAEEDAPFLTPDGNTLYFASTGHNSMGDYDIFKSVRNPDGTWGKAENLGPPINTPGHDRYFVTSDDGAVGYYASDRDGGYGETDIYRIVLDCKQVTNTIIRGIVQSEDLGGPIGATITVFDPKTNVIINTYRTDAKTGKYQMRLKTENRYGFKIECDGYMAHHGEFTVPKQCDYYSLFQEMRIETLEDSAGRPYAQRVLINNAFFDVDKKIEEEYADAGEVPTDDEQLDALRSEIAKKFNPIELTNYVRLIDVLDPNGVRLASETIGDKPVSTIQARDEYEASYSDKIMEADRQYYSEMYAEARVNYMIASGIKPEEVYPKQQVEIIENKIKDAPVSIYMATIPENDNSRLIVPQLIDSSEFIVPGDIAAAEPQAKSAEPKAATEKEEPAVAMVEQTETTKAPAVKAEPASTETTSEETQVAAVVVEKSEEAIQPTTAQAEEMVASEQSIEPDKPQATVSEIAAAQPTEEKVETVMEANAASKESDAIAEQQATTSEVAKEKQPTTATPTMEEETIVFRNILFDFDKSDLRKESIAELNKVSNYMKAKGGVEVQVDGHADWIGTVEYNMALSERRAKAATNHIVQKGGVDESRVTYQYFGEAVPIAPNANPDGSDNPEGRQLNRRCEFKIDKAGTADNVVLKF
ncbi:MAG: OmpA family protein [Flavobacteriales bacterium]